VFVRQVRFSLVRLSAETARPWRAHGSRASVVDGVDDHSPLRPRRRPLWNWLLSPGRASSGGRAVACRFAGGCRWICALTAAR